MPWCCPAAQAGTCRRWGFGGKPFKPEADEQRIWAQAEKEEAKIAKQAKLYDDPLLEEYLGRIGDRLTPEAVKQAGGPGFEFHVLRDPTLNAFAMPNGKVYVHTGLLTGVVTGAMSKIDMPCGGGMVEDVDAT